MADDRRMPMQIEGEPTKRYIVTYSGGTFWQDCNTAKEALEGYLEYEKVVRPVIDPQKKYRYFIRDRKKEITIGNFEKSRECGVIT
jgi:hypothetical protein